MSLWAILPVKEMEGSKQRLSPLLSPAERVALMRVMVAEVLDTLCVARGLAGTSVVTLTHGPRRGAPARARSSPRARAGGPYRQRHRGGRVWRRRARRACSPCLATSRGDLRPRGGARRGARPGPPSPSRRRMTRYRLERRGCSRRPASYAALRRDSYFPIWRRRGRGGGSRAWCACPASPWIATTRGWAVFARARRCARNRPSPAA